MLPNRKRNIPLYINFENVFIPHTKKEKENAQIEICHKLILKNIIRPRLEKLIMNRTC